MMGFSEGTGPAMAHNCESQEYETSIFSLLLTNRDEES